MINAAGFTKEGNWYKGNLHSHTTVSDGMLTPEQDVKLFRDGGYSFLCISDHDVYGDWRSSFDTDDFILIPGIEYSAILYQKKGAPERLKIHHLHGILGTREMQAAATEGLFTHLQKVPPMKFYGSWNGAEVSQKMADMLCRHGCIVTYNHPIWSRVSEEEFIHTKGIAALEIFNYNTVNESDTGYDVTYWDRMLRLGYRVNAFASDDNHNEGHFDDALGGWICVKARTLTHEDIAAAFVAGNYYSSSGPEIRDWGICDGTVWIDCSPVNRINFVSGNIINDGSSVLAEKFTDGLTHGEARLKGHETYVRAECVDKYGRKAWTNPIYINWQAE
jgi:hypothetical protein